jgi:Flp pilus assembly pilin Flp
MRRKFGLGAKRGLREERGAVAVEFAIILPVLLILTLGGMDLGHRYFIQYLTSNASREGARYAAKYTGSLAPPTYDAIRDYVKLPSGLNYDRFNLDAFTVVPNITAGIATVTVEADKNWWILDYLLGFDNPTRVQATTAMTVEQ